MLVPSCYIKVGLLLDIGTRGIAKDIKDGGTL